MPGGALNFFQVGVCGPNFRSVGLVNWSLLPKRGSCELKISKFVVLWTEKDLSKFCWKSAYAPKQEFPTDFLSPYILKIT